MRDSNTRTLIVWHIVWCPLCSPDVAHHGCLWRFSLPYLNCTSRGWRVSLSAPGHSCSASHLSLSDPACSIDCGFVAPVLTMRLPGSVADPVRAGPLTPLGRLSTAAHACSQGARSLNSSTCISLRKDHPACWHLLCLCRERAGHTLTGRPWPMTNSPRVANTPVPVFPMGTTLRCDLRYPQSVLGTEAKLPSLGLCWLPHPCLVFCPSQASFRPAYFGMPPHKPLSREFSCQGLHLGGPIYNKLHLGP